MSIKFYTALNFFHDAEIIEENSSIIINNRKWEIFHSPGHADDHISLYDRENGILFAGDNILRTKNIWFGPPGSNLNDYIRTLEYILSLPNLKIVLSSHGSPITEPRKRIKEIISMQKNRIMDAFNIINESGDSGITEKQLVRKLYPKKRWLKFFYAQGWVQLSLRYLKEQGKIIQKEKFKIIKYYTA